MNLRIFNVEISWENVKITLRVLWRSLLVGSLLAAIASWRYERFADRGVDADRDIMIVLLSLFGACLVMMVFEAFKDAFNKRQSLTSAISATNEKKFFNNVDKQIPYPLEMLIGFNAVLFFLVLMIIDLENDRVGMTVSFLVGFFFTLMREGAVIADNPLEGPWRLKFTEETKSWRNQALAKVRNKSFWEMLVKKSPDEKEEEEEEEV